MSEIKHPNIKQTLPLESCLPHSQGKRKSRVKQPSKKSTGRPRKNIDLTKLAEKARENGTFREMAAEFDISEDVLYRRYGDYIRKNKSLGRAALRGKAYKMAMDGDPKLMVFLLKNLLGMKEKQDITSNGDTVSVKILHGVDMNDL